jgi:hypothetical protein
MFWLITNLYLSFVRLNTDVLDCCVLEPKCDFSLVVDDKREAELTTLHNELMQYDK